MLGLKLRGLPTWGCLELKDLALALRIGGVRLFGTVPRAAITLDSKTRALNPSNLSKETLMNPEGRGLFVRYEEHWCHIVRHLWCGVVSYSPRPGLFPRGQRMQRIPQSVHKNPTANPAESISWSFFLSESCGESRRVFPWGAHLQRTSAHHKHPNTN